MDGVTHCCCGEARWYCRHRPRSDEDQPLPGLDIRLWLFFVIENMNGYHKECHCLILFWYFFVCPKLLFDLDRSDLPRSKYHTKPLISGYVSSKTNWIILIFTIYDISKWVLTSSHSTFWTYCLYQFLGPRCALYALKNAKIILAKSEQIWRPGIFTPLFRVMAKPTCTLLYNAFVEFWEVIFSIVRCARRISREAADAAKDHGSPQEFLVESFRYKIWSFWENVK